MASLIEDYALIGDTETAALVSLHGSIDWFCVPRFDSAACFAALLGNEDHGRWLITPAERPLRVERRYRGDTLVLETVFATSTGSVSLVDFMPVRGTVVPDRPYRPGQGVDHRQRRLTTPTIVRIVEGRQGTVSLHTEVAVRFDYGALVPWVRAHDHHGFSAVGGADGLVLYAGVPLRGQDLRHRATFDVHEGDRHAFSLTWFPSHLSSPPPFDAERSMIVTEEWWQSWAEQCTYEGPWRDHVRRSLITLKGLTYAPTGGIVAAATTSLPEWIGSVRNWDYRYCWLRDATFTLNALLDAGYDEEASAWSNWLRRAVAGSPDKMQIMYGVGGERRLDEHEVPWLPGYEDSRPVRIGNAASEQFQLDVYGEVMDMFLAAETRQVTQTNQTGERHAGLLPDALDLARFLVQHVREVWRSPDDGIWEVRGPRRHFVHSKVMAWVAIDRWVQLIERLGLEDPCQPWRDLRDEIHRDVITHGYNRALGSFTQCYGSDKLDASLLMMGLVGFLPPTDPRLIGTVEAVQRYLLVDRFVLRYETDSPASDAPASDAADSHVADLHGADPHAAGDTSVDGLPPGEGAFLLTTFWLVDSLVQIGREDEAKEIFERLLSLCNDVGLLSEEYDPTNSRMLGNFPQAFSHVGLLNSAFNLAEGSAAEARVHVTRAPGEGAATESGTMA